MQRFSLLTLILLGIVMLTHMIAESEAETVYVGSGNSVVLTIGNQSSCYPVVGVRVSLKSSPTWITSFSPYSVTIRDIPAEGYAVQGFQFGVSPTARVGDTGYLTFDVTDITGQCKGTAQISLTVAKLEDLGGVDFTEANFQYLTYNPEIGGIEFVMKAEQAQTGQPIIDVQNKIEKLKKAFLTTLTIPNWDLWISLDLDRVGDQWVGGVRIDEALSKTHLGWAMLDADVKMKFSDLEVMEDMFREIWAKWDGLLMQSPYYNEIRSGGYRFYPGFKFRTWITADKVTADGESNKIYITEARLQAKTALDEVFLNTSGYGFRAEVVNDLNRMLGEWKEFFKTRLQQVREPTITESLNNDPEYEEIRSLYGGVAVAQWYKKLDRTNLPYADLIDTKNVTGLEGDIPFDREYWADQAYKFIQAYNYMDYWGTTWHHEVWGGCVLSSVSTNVEKEVTTETESLMDEAIDKGVVKQETTYYFGQGLETTRPDLVASSLMPSVPTPTIGQAVILTATIRNQGTAKSNICKVHFFDKVETNGATSTFTIGENQILEIEPEMSQDVSINWTVSGPQGKHTIYVEVDYENLVKEIDENNNVTTAEISVVPSAPFVQITSPTDGESLTTALITFAGIGVDAQDGPLVDSVLVWTSNLDGVLETGGSFAKGKLTVGTHVITLTATDSDGNKAEDKVTINVYPEGYPIVKITSPVNGAKFAEGEVIYFEGSAKDAEDSVLSGTMLVWTSNINGLLGTGTSLNLKTLSPGNHTIILTATDSDGYASVADITITIAPGQPTAKITSPINGSEFFYEATINFVGTGDDPQDGTLTGNSLTWSSNVDGNIGSGTSISKTKMTPGEHTITLTVRDSHGLTDSDEITINILTPGYSTASISSPRNGQVFTHGSPIQFTGSGADGYGERPDSALTWSSSIDSVIGTGKSLTIDSANLSVGKHTITLTVTSTVGLTSTAQVDIIINSASPVVKVISPASGSIFRQEDMVTLTGQVTDLEDGTLTGTSLVWTSDIDGLLGTGTSVSKSGLTAGVHTVTLTATDSHNISSTDSISIVIVALGADITSTIFCDGVNQKELTYYESGNQTLYVCIPKVASVKNASLDIAGLNLNKGSLNFTEEFDNANYMDSATTALWSGGQVVAKKQDIRKYVIKNEGFENYAEHWNGAYYGIGEVIDGGKYPYASSYGAWGWKFTRLFTGSWSKIYQGNVDLTNVDKIVFDYLEGGDKLTITNTMCFYIDDNRLWSYAPERSWAWNDPRRLRWGDDIIIDVSSYSGLHTIAFASYIEGPSDWYWYWVGGGTDWWPSKVDNIRTYKYGYVDSVAVSKTISSTFGPVAMLRLDASDDLAGGSITYYVSADGGAHWEQVQKGQNHRLSYSGNNIRWKAELHPANENSTPTIWWVKVTISELYPTNPNFDATGDGDMQWNYGGELRTTVTTPDFTTELNSYLEIASADINGNVTVPLVFHSDSAGILNISNIRIRYQIVDLEPPIIHSATVTPNPADYPGQTLVVKAKVTDNHRVESVTATLLDTPISLSYNSASGLYEGTLTAPQAGDYTVGIVAKDPTGLTSITTVALRVNTQDPELYVSNISYVPVEPMEDKDITITAAIYNLGRGNADGISVKLEVTKLESLVFEATNVLSISANNVINTNFVWQPTEPGDYVLKVMADSTDKYSEPDETNNILKKNMHILDITPPVIHSLSVIEPVYEGGNLIVKVNVSDNVAVSNVVAIVGALVFNLNYNPQSGLYEATQPAPQSGEYVVTAQAVDASGLVSTRKVGLIVHRTEADVSLGIADISFSPTLLSDGTSVTINVVVHNNGGTEANNFPVELFVDGLPKASTTTSVSAGTTKVVQFVWTAVYGEHTLTIDLDSSNIIPEGNENNNETDKNIFVVDDTPPTIRAVYTSVPVYEGNILFIQADVTDNVGVKWVKGGFSPEIDFIYNPETGLYEGSVIGPEAGIHTLKVIATDTNELVSSKLTYLEVNKIEPDLVVGTADISLSPKTISEDQMMTIAVTIHNNGGQDANDFNVELKIDGEIKAVNTLSVAAGRSAVTNFNWTAIYGEHVLTIEVDSGKIIAETDEMNNIQTKKIFVSDVTPPPQPTLSVSPSGWTTSMVHTVSWEPVTDKNGIDRYEYKIDGGSWVSLGTNTSFMTPVQLTGIHTIYVRALDGTGNIGLPGVANIYIDTVTPNTPFILERHCGEGWTSHNSPYFNWSDPGDMGSGISHFMASIDDKEPFNIGKVSFYHPTFGPGEHTFKIYAVDYMGHESEWSNTVKVKIDLEPPATPVITSSTHPVQGVWYSDNIPDFSWFIPDDISGILGYYYALDRTSNTIPTEFSRWTEQITYQAMPLTDGVWYFHLIAVDNVGYFSTEPVHYEVRIDATPPVTFDDAPIGWQTIDFVITLIASDPYSGIAWTKYRIDDGEWQEDTSITIDFEGEHTIEYYSADNAGNIESLNTVQVALDKMPPNIIHTPVSLGEIGVAETIIAEVTDNYEVASVILYYRIAGVEDYTLVNMTSTTLPTYMAAIPEDVMTPVGCEYYIEAVDWVGNVSTHGTYQDPYLIITDNTPPAIIILSPEEGQYVRGKVMIETEVTDDITGVANVEYIGDGVTQWTSLPLMKGNVMSGIYSTIWNTTEENEGQHLVTLRATDVAGNNWNTIPNDSNPVSVSFFVDNTPPVTNAILSHQPNEAGWINVLPVTVSFSASDPDLTDGSPGSGVDIVPEPIIISTDGVHEISYYSIDKAGNVENAKVINVKIDTAPPDMVAISSPSPNSNGWNNTNVTVNFTAVDPNLADGNPGSGIIDISNPVVVTKEGAGQAVVGRAIDEAGNVRTVTLTLNIDKTLPVLNVSQIPEPNEKGWNNTDVTITYTATDNLSGIDSLPSEQIITTEGKNQVITATAIDKAGNSTQTTVTLNIDKTLPVITAVASPEPNINGWNNSNVTVSYTATDSLSGIDEVNSSYANDIVSTEGAGIVVDATVYDNAGNLATIAKTVNLDKSNPIIIASSRTPANSWGWNNTPVTVTYAVEDILSGVDEIIGGYETDTVSTEGKEQTTTATVTDRAGNSDSVTVTDINIDLTPSVIIPTLSPTPNANGWNNTDVTVNYSVSDSLSGIDSLISDYNSDIVSAEGLGIVTSGTLYDKAGNKAEALVSLNIDKTPPRVTTILDPEPNENNWNNTDVIVSFKAIDSLSGIEEIDSPVIITTEGKGQIVNGSATDKAGNRGITSTTLNIDKTPPVIFARPSPGPNEYGWNNQSVTINYTVTDNLSGAETPPPVILSNEGQNQLVPGITIMDHAGNVSTPCADIYVSIDKTAPIITASASPSPNKAGWNNTDVTVTYTCNDALSGIAIAPAGQLITTEGRNQYITGTVTDKAGNTASTSVTLNVDKTPPATTPQISPTPNKNGWNNTLPVTVNFLVQDNLSGPAITPEPVYVNSEGIHLVDYYSTDVAGNVEPIKTITIKIDLVAPIVNITKVEEWTGNEFVEVEPVNEGRYFFYNINSDTNEDTLIRVSYTTEDPLLADGNTGSGIVKEVYLLNDEPYEDQNLKDEGITLNLYQFAGHNTFKIEVTDAADNTSFDTVDFIITLIASIILEPEALKVNPGILTAFVQFPEGYDVVEIDGIDKEIGPFCDGALAERMMLNDDGTVMIMKFRRADIEDALARMNPPQSIDISFTVIGSFGGRIADFEAAGEIMKIVDE